MRARLIDLVIESAQPVSGDDRAAVAVCLSLSQCFPCGAKCTPAAVGRFMAAPESRALYYPMCMACRREATSPRTAQAFAQAIRRRFVKLGEVEA